MIIQSHCQQDQYENYKLFILAKYISNGVKNVFISFLIKCEKAIKTFIKLFVFNFIQTFKYHRKSHYVNSTRT